MSDNAFDNMIKQFKDHTSLKDFCEAQHKTIISLGKTIRTLEVENLALKANGAAPREVKIDLNTNMSSEEVICLTQLAVLKAASECQELTLEEAKKVDIYSKILNNIKNNKKSDSLPLTNMSNDELLKLAENE